MKLTVGRGGLASLASLLLLPLLHAAPAHAQARCNVDKDCRGSLVCTYGTCTTPPGTRAPESSAPSAPSERRPSVRVGFVYSPGILVSDASRTGDPANPLAVLGGGTHLLGAELALGGGYFRYHLTGAFVAASGGGATGFRLEPTTLGVAIPLVKKGPLRLEIEPTVMVVNVGYLGATDGPASLVTLSSGADLRANLAFGKLFVAASPLGFDVRYAAIDASEAKAHAFSGGAVAYRLRLVVGAEF